MSNIIDKIKAQGTQASVLIPELAEQIAHKQILAYNIDIAGLAADCKKTISLTNIAAESDIKNSAQLFQLINSHTAFIFKIRDTTSPYSDIHNRAFFVNMDRFYTLNSASIKTHVCGNFIYPEDDNVFNINCDIYVDKTTAKLDLQYLGTNIPN